MPLSTTAARAGLLVLATALSASAIPIRDGPSVFSPDAAGSMQKRAIMKGDNYIPLGSTTVPLTPLLLIFGGLGAAAVGLVIALLRILVPSCMSRSSRIVLEERERARQDLRVRGAVSPRASPGGSPTGGNTPTHAHMRRFPPNKPPRRVGRNSRGSLTPAESASLSSTSKRPSHGYRGTSFSLSEARRHTDKSHRSSGSGFQLPLLNSNDSSSGSSSFHVNARESGMSERARYPITATNEPLSPRNGGNRRLSLGTRHLLNRTSSIGKGADLQRTRSGRQNHEIALQPQAVDPAYSQQKWGRRESYTHPLQQQQHAPSRRDSTFSMYEVSSSSAEHSYLESNTTSRIGSFSNMSGNPLQPLSMPGFGGAAHGNQPWASPRMASRSPSPEFVTPDPSRLAVVAGQGASSNSSVSGLLDSDGSDHASHTAVLIPSRATSITI
ncbi:uncharacterized protein UTRI_04345 [Ustilago trichophora]|uniref:Uncharacterized protein n=1 Tax=Ustilago trichophora TaxID=86804 RepID=A0A5C3ETG1_9BASI|nr:uncharacterized protein UTRI_04345 [Ustilago trichophora]